jgi:hypothetical protein
VGTQREMSEPGNGRKKLCQRLIATVPDPTIHETQQNFHNAV